MDADSPYHFSDEQARAILARAIEIDARAPMTTLDDLRAIASEIGVSPASLDAAIGERTSAEAGRTDAGARIATAFAGLGVPLGMGAGWLLASGTGPGMLGVSGIWLAASAGVVVSHGATVNLRSFHLRNSALWIGVLAGSLASAWLVGGDAARLPVVMAVGWCIRGWVTSSVLGSAAVVAVRRARRPRDRDGDSASAEASGRQARSRWARIADQLLAWMPRQGMAIAEKLS